MISRKLKTAIAVVSTIVMVGFLFVWFGMFNVAATDKHWAITTAFLELVRDRSISSNAEEKQVPDLSQAELIASGAPNYQAMCAQCHLSPGVKTSEFYQGLNPQPPVFHNGEATGRDPVAAFWIISNGIKMTGMASWGNSHTDLQIWEMIAFINELPNMDAEVYKKMVGEGQHTHKDGAPGHAESSTPGTNTGDHHAGTNKEEAGKPADHHGKKALNGENNVEGSVVQGNIADPMSNQNQSVGQTVDHHGNSVTNNNLNAGSNLQPETGNLNQANVPVAQNSDHHGNPIANSPTNGVGNNLIAPQNNLVQSGDHHEAGNSAATPTVNNPQNYQKNSTGFNGQNPHNSQNNNGHNNQYQHNNQNNNGHDNQNQHENSQNNH